MWSGGGRSGGPPAFIMSHRIFVTNSVILWHIDALSAIRISVFDIVNVRLMPCLHNGGPHYFYLFIFVGLTHSFRWVLGR